MKPGWRIRRLTDGSALVARRLGRAFVPLGEDGEIRLIAAGVRLSAGAYLGNATLGAVHQHPLWLLGGTCAWCWAAWRATSPATAAGEDDESDGDWAWSPDEVRAYVDQLLPDLIADRNGVHLDTVLGAAQDAGALPGSATVADLRRDLEARGYTVRSSLKVDSVNRVGIHRDDLPAALEPLPDHALPLAG